LNITVLYIQQLCVAT